METEIKKAFVKAKREIQTDMKRRFAIISSPKTLFKLDRDTGDTWIWVELSQSWKLVK